MKAQAINRKQFLQATFKSVAPIRPPWSIEESLFTDNCTRCFECANSCSSNLIIKGAGGFPAMSFLRQGCDYCEACVHACPQPVLFFSKINRNSPWQQQAIINDQCFSEKGIVCRSCTEVCEVSAIEFKLVVGGSGQININSELCNGCGECVHVCPAQAIKIQKISKGETV